ncbi:copper chaperone PCu(A)C [Sphingomicrobium nitratireducens]|uniref:copper chaperone PCu(A)C n=1 Tax=Sphingomicrobium nitratireducens TaxID=2964666 RepID=UPI00223F931D|nr:copper chaperone PCu(A)C [Sphingomicrobium nitratireducens]
MIHRLSLRQVLTLGSALLLAACAPQKPAAEPVVEDAWARSTVEGQKMAAAYFTLRNEGETELKLTGVSTNRAGSASLHRSAVDNGVATMRPLEGGLLIEPGETIAFEPGGDHVMLEMLEKPLVEGETFPMTLEFAAAAPITLEVKIVGAGER